MESSELLRRVRKIEIKTRGITTQVFSGQYHSAFKGRGMAFSEVREYMPGDDIRSIDLNVTARLNHPYVKVFEEERELTVMLLVDVSASGQFGNHFSVFGISRFPSISSMIYLSSTSSSISIIGPDFISASLYISYQNCCPKKLYSH